MSRNNLLSKAREKSLRIAIVGFGYIGECIGAVLADCGYDVTGIDVNSKLVDAFNDKRPLIRETGLDELVGKYVPHSLRATTDFSALTEADFVIITVGTPIDDDYVPRTDYVVDACRHVANYLRKGQVVTLKSTTPPLTTETIVRPILEESGLKAGVDFFLGFCPERIAEGVALAELRNIPIVVGGINAESAEVLSELWNTLLGVSTLIVSSPTAAEMSKLADNAFIDLNVALANEIAMVCDQMGLDALEVIRAANSLKKGQHYVNILHPAMGVGGTCLTKDPWFIHELGKKHDLDLKVFAAGRQVNEKMPIYTADKIERALGGLKSKKVAVLGVTFKSNTGDLRFTPVKPLVERLEQRGATVTLCDPLVLAHDMEHHMGGRSLVSLEDAVRWVDAIGIMAPHREFMGMDLLWLKAHSGATVFLDGRNAFDRRTVERAGFEYYGIGR